MKEVRREKAAKAFAEQLNKDVNIVSSWGTYTHKWIEERLTIAVIIGPYTSTSGTAKKTGVSGLTTPAEMVAQK